MVSCLDTPGVILIKETVPGRVEAADYGAIKHEPVLLLFSHGGSER